MATIITTVDIMMSVTIRTSSMKPGSGVIKAITMPRTAMGTPSSFQLVNASFHGAGAAIAFACAANLHSFASHAWSRRSSPAIPKLAPLENVSRGVSTRQARVPAPRPFFDSDNVSCTSPAIHQLEDVGQHFGHGAIELRRNFLSHVDGLIQRLRQRGIFDERNLVLHRDRKS